MVEAPGTAPGSEALMSRGVYRHSRLPDTTNIGARRGFLKRSLCASPLDSRSGWTARVSCALMSRLDDRGPQDMTRGHLSACNQVPDGARSPRKASMWATLR